MADGRSSMSGNWTSTQAYVLSIICLLAGVAVGYLVRGSPWNHSAETVVPAPAQAIGTGASMRDGMSPTGTAQQRTPEQLRQVADAQAQPLLAQLKGDPNNAELLYKIGNLYYDAQQYPEAVKYYERALRIDPKATDVRTDMATAYHFMGESDRAIKEYDEVLKIDGKHANALFNEGMVKWQDKMDMNGAIAAWNRLLETNPDYPQRDRVRNLIAQAEQHLTIKPSTHNDKSAGTAK